MNRKFIFISLILFSSVILKPNLTLSQDRIEDYLLNGGIETLATLVHPTNTRIAGTTRLSSYQDFVIVPIYYKEATTKLKLYRGNYPFFVRRIEVISDNDFPAPFLAIEFLKNIVMSAVNEEERRNPDSNLSKFEREFRAIVTKWNGYQLALFALNSDIGNY